jgi:hypothetical protein
MDTLKLKRQIRDWFNKNTHELEALQEVAKVIGFSRKDIIMHKYDELDIVNGGIVYGGTVCGGYRHCTKRTYDERQPDCQKCEADAHKGLQQAETLCMEKKKPEPLKFLPLPNHGDHMTVKEFYQCCMRVDSMEGECYYANEHQITNKTVDVDLFVNIVDHPFSHVVWFNK